ncbi:hypothetical protein [Actinomadura geliboluensis]|uniref:hypothetical protein n=1 Tax=Actinomadura geliboluensis TaxID=882440 RepID=UPI00261DE2B6|nr:hypothetical protein [Actinomadura geliboluensis]
MARTTGPVLAIGGITFVNKLIQTGDVDIRVPVGTGIAAVLFSLAERVSERLAVGIAWIALTAVCLTRVDPKVPSPAETLLKYWK